MQSLYLLNNSYSNIHIINESSSKCQKMDTFYNNLTIIWYNMPNDYLISV